MKVFNQLNIKKKSIVLISYDTINVSNDLQSPSIFTGLTEAGESSGFILHDDSSIENVSGKILNKVVGTISFQPFKTGGGVTQLALYSEFSDDGGLTWNDNPWSLRTIEVPRNGESFNTGISAVVNWENGRRYRFKFVENGGGGLVFTTTSLNIEGEERTGASVFWELSEI